MLIKARQKYIRESPRKLRLVIDAIRHLPPQEALDQLSHMRKRGSLVVRKTIKQALANAQSAHNLAQESVRFALLKVDTGPTFKRWRAVSRGRAHQIHKRTAHLTVFLESVAPLSETGQRPQTPPAGEMKQTREKPKPKALPIDKGKRKEGEHGKKG